MTAKKNKHHRIKLWSIRFPVLNDIERIFKQLQTCETFEPCDVVERLGHFDGIASSLACIPTKQHGVRGGKYLLNTPGDAISEILNFTMSLDASALKNVRLWCEFQSRLLFIISLLLKNVLTALIESLHQFWPHFPFKGKGPGHSPMQGWHLPPRDWSMPGIYHQAMITINMIQGDLKKLQGHT